MTTKSSPDSVVLKWEGSLKYQDGTTDVLQSPSYSTAKWTNSVTTGDNIPGWRELLRQGYDATTSLVGERSEAHLISGRLYVSIPKNLGIPWQIRSNLVVGSMNIGSALPTVILANVSTSEADAKALARFNQRITNSRTAIQGGVVLGELGQTLRMIRNPAQGLRRLVDDWGVTARSIRGQRVYPLAFRKKKVTENLADAWLETQFGWKPLLSDVKAGATALAKHNIASQGVANLPIRGSAAVDVSVSESISGMSISMSQWKNVSVEVVNTSVRYRGAIRVEPRNPAVFNPTLFGFDPASWLPTAWELTPYSFLIDYFSNVGDVIEGWSTLNNRLAWCNRTARVTAEKTTTSWTNIKLIRSTVPSVNEVSFKPAKYVCRKIRVSRASYNGNFIPDFVLEIPGLGSKKWLNIAALLASRDADRTWKFD